MASSGKSKTQSIPTNIPLCPECSIPMALRNGKFGLFWGCSKYPVCRGIRTLKGTAKKPTPLPVRVEPKRHTFVAATDPDEECPFDGIPREGELRTAFGPIGNLTLIGDNPPPSELDDEFQSLFR